MKLFGFHISRRAQKNLSPVTRHLSPEAWMRGEDLDREGTVLSNAYQQVVWVYRAINVLAEQVANVPFLFSSGERGREDLITTGPLIDFYSRPHPQINRFQYWELRIIWLMLRGESFRIPIYSDSLNPNPNRNLNSDSPRHSTPGARHLQRILILDPAHFQHIVENHQLIGWRYTGFGPQTPLASQVFLPEEVWFEKLPNPFDFWRGLAPLYAATMAAKTDFAASAFMRGIIENNADTGVIVRTEKALGPEQQAQLVAHLRDRKRRAGTADRPLLLSGVSEIIKPELSSSDLQFLENRKFSRAEICAAFGVPEEIVATSDHNKYDVMQGARLNFIENRVAPLCGRLEAEEQVTVKTLDPQAVGWFDLESLAIMQEARRNRLLTAKTGFDMGVPFNELNRVFDLGFKRLPWGDAGYVASKLQKVGEDGNFKTQNPISKKAPNPKAPGPLSDFEATVERALDFFHDSDNSGGDQALILSPEWAPENPETRKSKRSKLSRFLFEQRGRVLAKLDHLLRDGGVRACLKPGDALTLRRINAASNLFVELFDLAGENSRLTEYIGHTGHDLSRLNQGTFAELTKTLARGIVNSETIEQLAARVRSVYNEAAKDTILHQLTFSDDPTIQPSNASTTTL